MSKFQIILTSAFVLCIVAGVTAFATFKGSSSTTELPAITVWGTFPQSLFNQYINKLNMSRSEALRISYTEIAEEDFDKTFIEALARGQGPDSILISQDLVHKHEDKIIPVPYKALTQRDFQNTYIKQAELYLGSEGTLAIPFMLDPLVMYWNRDTFTNAGVAVFPKYWDEFSAIGKKINKKDANSNIQTSTLAMGEFTNISHAREILGTLLLQTGNPVTYRDGSDVASSLGDGSYLGLSTSLPALNFFTKFSDPRNSDYSWNRSLPNSKSFFLSGKLATYIGYASEIFDIRQKNPNLDFDVAALPQCRDCKDRNNQNIKAVFGSMYGFSIVRSTKNAGATYSVLNNLLTPDALSEMVKLAYLPPVRRDMIATGSTDPYLSIFYDSALISKGWLDTSKTESFNIFKNIIESVTSGRSDPTQALQNAREEYDASLKNI